VLGGMLSLNHHDVCLIARSAHADAVAAGGLRIKSTTAEYHAHPSAGTALSAERAAAAECVVLGVKSQDIPSAMDALSASVSSDVPLVGIQNGVAAERAVAARFARVYGAVIRMTCSMVQPGHVSYSTGGRVVVGKYPRGSDAFARTFAGLITAAGFDAVVTKG